MKQQILSIVLALAIGLVGGYAYGNATSASEDDKASSSHSSMNHDDSHEHDHSHAHDNYEVPDDEPKPSVEITAHEDPMSGWNIQIETENFTFVPESASLDHVPGEGHAHIYVNDEKINRVYGNWYHLGSVPEGDVEVRVSLSTNDHLEYTVDGKAVEDTVTLQHDHE